MQNMFVYICTGLHNIIFVQGYIILYLYRATYKGWNLNLEFTLFLHGIWIFINFCSFNKIWARNMNSSIEMKITSMNSTMEMNTNSKLGFKAELNITIMDEDTTQMQQNVLQVRKLLKVLLGPWLHKLYTFPPAFLAIMFLLNKPFNIHNTLSTKKYKIKIFLHKHFKMILTDFTVFIVFNWNVLHLPRTYLWHV